MKQSAESSLTGRQTRLVDTLVANGCSIREAAKIAGYSGGSGSDAGRVTASKTLRLPHVQAYYQQQLLAQLHLVAPRALNRLASLLDANSEYVQLEASKQILDRAGFGKVTDDVKITHGTVRVRIDLS
jgi:phage terminase small subunit